MKLISLLLLSVTPLMHPPAGDCPSQQELIKIRWEWVQAQKQEPKQEEVVTPQPGPYFAQPQVYYYVQPSRTFQMQNCTTGR